MNTQNEPAQQLANDIIAEYSPDSREAWMSVIRLISRMSTSAKYRATERQIFNQTYVILKMKYREFERKLIKQRGVAKND